MINSTNTPTSRISGPTKVQDLSEVLGFGSIYTNLSELLQRFEVIAANKHDSKQGVSNNGN